MRLIGPWTATQKLLMTIGTSALTLVAVVTFITHLSTGSGEWPFYAVCVLAGAAMVVMVRRTPTAGGRK